MRLANLNGRAVLLHDDRALDIERASGGRFNSDPMAVWEDWTGLTEWAATADFEQAEPFEPDALGAPIPRPRQVFAIGLNYRDHAEESHMGFPDAPVVFTKFQSSLAGPFADVKVPGHTLDYEAEMVVAIGREARDVSEESALDVVAGYATGQDYSEREVQLRPPAPQFSLGKSYPAFGPFGPALVTPDELGDPSDLDIRCEISGPTSAGKGLDVWVAQNGNTANMIFSVPRLIADLSAIVTLYPGDLIFTGTPAGVGGPQGVALKVGDVVTTTIEGLGTIRNAMV